MRKAERAYAIIKELVDEKRKRGTAAAKSLAFSKYGIDDTPVPGRGSIWDLVERTFP